MSCVRASATTADPVSSDPASLAPEGRLLVLGFTGGNQHQAARLLGIARQTLRVKLRDLGLQVTHSVEEAIYLGDRVFRMATQPGRLVEILELPRPDMPPEVMRKKPWFNELTQELLRRLGFRARWRLDWTSEPVRRIVRLAAWVFLYVLVNQLGLLQIIVLSAGRTGFTAFISAFTFFQLPHAIFAVSIMTALLPSLSGQWAAGERDAFRGLLARGIRSTAFIVVPAALGYIVLAQPIVRLLLQHGATGPRGADLVANVLVYFSLGLFSFSVFQLLLRAFYAMQDTKTPALINIAAVTLNVIVNFVYFPFLGVKGLALGNTVAYTFASVVSIAIIRRRLGGVEGAAIVRGLAQVLVASGVTAGIAFAISKLMEHAVSTATLAGQAAQVVVSVGAGIVTFVAVASAMHMSELQVLKGLIPERYRR